VGGAAHTWRRSRYRSVKTRRPRDDHHPQTVRVTGKLGMTLWDDT